MNGCAPGLALIERLKETRKWAILQHGTSVLLTVLFHYTVGWDFNKLTYLHAMLMKSVVASILTVC